jgi:hypothetical protein
MAEFVGFTKEAFDAYTPEKWASNVHNLKRMRVKDALVALCDGVQKNLEAEWVGLARGTSDEIPNIMNNKKVDAQWVYWFRDPKSREALASFLEKLVLNEATIFNLAPQDKHIALTVVLRNEALFAGLRLPKGATVDRRNLTAKLEKTWERDYLLELLGKLPETVLIGLESEMQPAASMTPELLEQLLSHMADSDAALLVGQYFSVDEVIALGAELSEPLRHLLASLTPIYRFIAWTRENDFIEAGKQLQEEKQIKRRSSGFHPGDKVRISSGLFSGKSGIVQETDTKGQVRVMVGKMAVVVANQDLTAERA